MAFGRPKKIKVLLSKALAIYWTEYMPLADKAPDALTQDNFKLRYWFGRCRIDPEDSYDRSLEQAKVIFKSILVITKQLPGKKRAKLVVGWTEGGAVGNMGLRNHIAISKTRSHVEEFDTVNSLDSWMRRNPGLANSYHHVSWHCEIRNAF